MTDNNLEWEVLQEPLIIEEITLNKWIPKNSISIVVNRTDSYQIRAVLTAIEENGPLAGRDTECYKRFYKTSPGSRIEPFNLKGKDQYGSNVELKNCYITHIGSRGRNSSERLVTLNIIVYEIKIEKNSDYEASRLLEWYINGPNNGVLFPRETLRLQENGSDKAARKRVTVDISLDKAIELSIQNIESSEMDREFALVTFDTIKFIVARVLNGFGPDWSKNICIEYRKDFGPIPDSQKREAISEIVSFVLGTQLLNVGFTEYDHEWQPLTFFAKPSWGVGYSRSVCEDITLSPFDLGIIINEGKIEELLCDLVPKYLSLRDKMRLKEALWKYWISRDMPLGTNLPALSSALEIIKEEWFKSEKSKSKALWIPNEEFEDLIEESLNIAEEKLDKYIENKNKSLDPEKRHSLKAQEMGELKKQVLNKIRYSNQMSLTKRYAAFFEEIGLEIGSIEDKAIASRHSMAHSDKMNAEESEKMEKCTRAYQTLFHRVFLKVLGYEGRHIDRSVIGFPEKNINLPLGKINKLNVESLALISKKKP
ncbi:HEPN domain-containing protein [Methanosarcina sp.]|uniref:HEPN domain-containing protein n=1 Tax=Methanosarcina sp. TaxID=2213 RepID=UPI003C782C29